VKTYSKPPSKALEATELVPAAPRAIGIYKRSERLSAALLQMGDLRTALEAIAEKIYILRLRYIPGPAKAIALI
jgi:hypothetical protein